MIGAALFLKLLVGTAHSRDPNRMHETLMPAPGAVHGLYPQRHTPETSWLEQRLASLWRGVQRPAAARSLDGQGFVLRVNRLAEELKSLTQPALHARTEQVRNQLMLSGFDSASAAQAFALVREFSTRVLGMRHYDAQVLGGWFMLNGMVVELETGAGKTLTATLPVCTAALAGIPAHVVTVNDYLVQRDAQWMRPLYAALGLNVGTVLEATAADERRAAYSCHVTYTTSKQLVFDYLKDRLVLGKLAASPLQLRIDGLQGERSRLRQLLLRGLCFAVVDEADSVLIDESRTPLIISRETGGVEQELAFHQALELAQRLRPKQDFQLTQRLRLVELTESGKERVAALAQAYAGIWRNGRSGEELASQALSALHLYLRDKHYMIKDGKIQIVDEFTGRTLADRSWERGLHQMIEAKEGCPLTRQKETLARISYQQFFRRYLRLAGMTGTAQEVARELWSVYRLNVASVAPQWASKRIQQPTRVSVSSAQKWRAVVTRVSELHARGQPVLVGTRSVAMSEHLSRLLQEAGVAHQVLNARQDQQEAAIVATAGERASVVVATNMAGRGTDIKLGAGVAELGGLHVIATELHEARRIDRQLFGRCARQGDPGGFEMLVSLEDELVEVYCPLLLRLPLKAIKRSPSRRPARWGWWIARAAQMAAEREHSRQRRGMLQMDEQLKTLLAFSGALE
jgi:preprotein translocase subunit SecA